MLDSPFPGMDPYREEPSLWGGVHTRLMTTIADDLAERLAPDYVVGLEERVYCAGDDDTRRPVVPNASLAIRAVSPPDGGGTAVATPPATCRRGLGRRPRSAVAGRAGMISEG